ncbi:MAG: Asp-tRNA(Asn)/Glu-tRNA(Gln) amidotransferase subunit GatC [Patescibacteria group bacterium]
MTLSHEIQHITRLARLKLSEEEQKGFGSQLTSILDYVSEIQSQKTEGVEPTHTVSGALNVSRNDDITCVSGEMTRDKFLSQSSMREGDFLKVPGVFET